MILSTQLGDTYTTTTTLQIRENLELESNNHPKTINNVQIILWQKQTGKLYLS